MRAAGNLSGSTKRRKKDGKEITLLMGSTSVKIISFDSLGKESKAKMNEMRLGGLEN